MLSVKEHTQHLTDPALSVNQLLRKLILTMTQETSHRTQPATNAAHDPLKSSTNLRIHSLNVDKSPTTLQSLLQNMTPTNTDILCIQECPIKLLKLSSLNPAHWIHIFPSKPSLGKTSLSCAMYISILLSTTIWEQLTVLSAHIMVIQITTDISDFILCNTYNIPKSNKTI